MVIRQERQMNGAWIWLALTATCFSAQLTLAQDHTAPDDGAADSPELQPWVLEAKLAACGAQIERQRGDRSNGSVVAEIGMQNDWFIAIQPVQIKQASQLLASLDKAFRKLFVWRSKTLLIRNRTAL